MSLRQLRPDWQARYVAGVGAGGAEHSGTLHAGVRYPTAKWLGERPHV